MSKPIRTTPSRALDALRGNLKSLAEKNQWTQGKLGEKIGVAQRQAGRILNGEHEPTLATLSDIASKLGISEPMLLVPHNEVDQLLSNPAISAPLRALIEELVRLDKDGTLTEPVVKHLSDSIKMIFEAPRRRDKQVKEGAQ